MNDCCYLLMGSENDKKRLDVEVDKISSLPDDLIHNILSFIDNTIDAIKTSTLSSRWRFIWTTMTCLAFSSDDFPSLPKFTKFVKNVLSGHNYQREVSSVKLTYRGEFSQVFLERVLDGLISKCVNLKNITLTSCYLEGAGAGASDIDLNIFHSQLSNLTIDKVPMYVRFLRVVAPKHKNLTIRKYAYSSAKIMISVPDLTYLLLGCFEYLMFSADDFHFLEKANISIIRPNMRDLISIIGLFQLLRSVKNLTLNLEILEYLSSSVETISLQPSPFANLKSLKIYPSVAEKCQLSKEIINISMEVKNYLLDGSTGATFTMVSREEIIAKRNAMYAKERMDAPRVHLHQEIADIETHWGRIEVKNVLMESPNALMEDEQNALDENELQIEGTVAHINSCWESLGEQIKQGKKTIDEIVRELRDIKKLMTKMHASNMAEIQPYFSSLCAQAEIVMSKIRDYMKIQLDENQSRFDELATTLQSFS